MARMREVAVAVEPIDRFRRYARAPHLDALEHTFALARERFAGSVLWHINSTPRGGGVAEMLPWLLGYLRGGGIDTRWLTIEAPSEFFAITKRLHHALHGAEGDRSPLGEQERALFEEVAWDNAEEFLTVLDSDDVVILHDPQTAAMIPTLARNGAAIIWRCHIGTDERNEQTEVGWRFLAPYLGDAKAAIFSRRAFIPSLLADRSVVIHPSIDIFAPKNQELEPEVVRAILAHVGFIAGPSSGKRSFRRIDGAPGRVDRAADLITTGSPPAPDAPLVVQVSRWDPLKDPIGVMQGFVSLMRTRSCGDAQLVLAGPSVHSVKDDPEAASTLDAAIEVWRGLPAHERRRITLACLPMADVQENAAIVNALQRHATVVVQKSVQEGFGLTVTEAMWKRRPVIASAVGGIREQIEHGVHGLLLEDPRDLLRFGEQVGRVLADPRLAARLGEAAEARVRAEFLPVRQLNDGLLLALAVARGERPEPGRGVEEPPWSASDRS